MMTEAWNGSGAEERVCEPDEVFGSLTETEMDALRREVSGYTAKDAYRDHYREVAGDPTAEPTTPFEELTDMALQFYETAADMVNAQQAAQGEQ